MQNQHHHKLLTNKSKQIFSFNDYQLNHNINSQFITSHDIYQYTCYKCGGNKEEIGECSQCKGLKYVADDNVLTGLLLQVMCFMLGKEVHIIKKFPVLEFSSNSRNRENKNLVKSFRNRGSLKQNKNKSGNLKKQYFSQTNSMNDSNSMDSSLDSYDNSNNSQSNKIVKMLPNNKTINQQIQQIKQQSYMTQERILICDICQKQGEVNSDYLECKVCKHFFVCINCYDIKKKEQEKKKKFHSNNQIQKSSTLEQNLIPFQKILPLKKKKQQDQQKPQYGHSTPQIFYDILIPKPHELNQNYPKHRTSLTNESCNFTPPKLSIQNCSISKTLPKQNKDYFIHQHPLTRYMSNQDQHKSKQYPQSNQKIMDNISIDQSKSLDQDVNINQNNCQNLGKLDQFIEHDVNNKKHNTKVEKLPHKRLTLQRSYTTGAQKQKPQQKEEFKNLFKVYQTDSNSEPNTNNSNDNIIKSPIASKFKYKMFSQEQKHPLQGIQTIKQQKQSPFSSQRSGFISPKSLTNEKKTSFDQKFNIENIPLVSLTKGMSQNQISSNKIQNIQYEKYKKLPSLNCRKIQQINSKINTLMSNSPQSQKNSQLNSSSQLFQQNIRMTISNSQSPQKYQNICNCNYQNCNNLQINEKENQQIAKNINNNDAGKTHKQNIQNTVQLQKSQKVNQLSKKKQSQISSQSSIPYKIPHLSSQNSSLISPSAIPSSIPTIYSRQVYLSKTQNIDRKHCCYCLTQITNRSMYMKCETCQKTNSMLYILCASCYNSNQVINKHHTNTSTKHLFRAYLHRIHCPSVDHREIQNKDDWMGDQPITNQYKQPNKNIQIVNVQSEINNNQFYQKQAQHNININKSGKSILSPQSYINTIGVAQSPMFLAFQEPQNESESFSMAQITASNQFFSGGNHFNTNDFFSKNKDSTDQNTYNMQKNFNAQSQQNNQDKSYKKKKVDYGDCKPVINLCDNNSTQIQCQSLNYSKDKQNQIINQSINSLKNQEPKNQMPPNSTIITTTQKKQQQLSTQQNTNDSSLYFSYYDYNSEQSKNKRKKIYENNMKYQLIFQNIFNKNTNEKQNKSTHNSSQQLIQSSHIDVFGPQVNLINKYPNQLQPQINKITQCDSQNINIPQSQFQQITIRKSLDEVVNGHWLLTEQDDNEQNEKIPNIQIIKQNNKKQKIQIYNGHMNRQTTINDKPRNSTLKNGFTMDRSKTSQEKPISHDKNHKKTINFNDNIIQYNIMDQQHQNNYQINQQHANQIAGKSKKTVSSNKSHLSSRIKVQCGESSQSSFDRKHQQQKKQVKRSQNTSLKCKRQQHLIKQQQKQTQLNKKVSIKSTQKNQPPIQQKQNPTNFPQLKTLSNKKKKIKQKKRKWIINSQQKLQSNKYLQDDIKSKKYQKQQKKNKKKHSIRYQADQFQDQQEFSQYQSESHSQSISKSLQKKQVQEEKNQQQLQPSSQQQSFKQSKKKCNKKNQTMQQNIQTQKPNKTPHDSLHMDPQQSQNQNLLPSVISSKQEQQKNILKIQKNQPFLNNQDTTNKKQKIYYNRQQQQQDKGQTVYPQQAFIFESYQCDLCQQIPVNYRYHCTICKDYDICGQCYKKCEDLHEHGPTKFERFDKQKQLQLQRQLKQKQQIESLKKNDVLLAIMKKFLPDFNKDQQNLINTNKIKNNLQYRNTFTSNRNSNDYKQNYIL